MTKKKRNPTDSTLRNVRAANKRIARLEQWCEMLTLDLDDLYQHLKTLPFRISINARMTARGKGKR